MARHSSHLDEKMVQVGLKLIEKKGSKALTIREICRMANVNLGLFVYYFKNKDNYLKCLFETIHNRLMHFVSEGMYDEMTSLEKTKHFYKGMAEYAYRNKNLLRMFFVESAIEKDLYATYFKKGITPRPIDFFSMTDMQKDGCLKSDVAIRDIQCYMLFHILLPILFSECRVLLGDTHEISEAPLQTYINQIDDYLDSIVTG